MGVINLRHVKDRHKIFLEQELQKTDDPTIQLYLKNMIKSIKDELEVKKDSYYMDDNVTMQLIKIVDKLGLSIFNVKVLTALLCNDFIGASRFAKDLRMDRALVYRTLNHLIEMRIVTIIEGSVKKYCIINQDDPFGGYIDYKTSELESLRNFQLITEPIRSR